MKKTRILLICLITLLATQLACLDFLQIFQGKPWCEMNGGVWIDEDSDRERWLMNDKHEFCDNTKDDTVDDSSAEGTKLDGCWVPEQTKKWLYVPLSEEKGQFCNAEFVYTNTEDQTVAIIYQETWNSNAQDGIQWNNVLLEPGEQWVRRSSYAWRSDGDTYNYITQMMVVYYTPDCSWLTYDQETEWEETSIDLPLPCQKQETGN